MPFFKKVSLRRRWLLRRSSTPMAQQVDTQLTSRNPQAEELLAEGSESLSTIMDSVTGVHVSPAIPPEDFELGRMKPLSYTREALSAAIVHNVRRSLDPKQIWTIEDISRYGSGTKNLSARQKQAIERLKYQGYWNIGRPNNIQDIKKFFEIFDDAYFGGLLKGYCRFELPNYFDCRDIRYGHSPPLGVCEGFFPEGEYREKDTRFRIEKPYVIITIRLDDSSPSMCDRIKNYLEVLLHEMLHAIFFIYTCRCEHGCKQSHEHEAGGYRRYIESHHMEWQAAALAIEEADEIRRCLLGLSINLSRGTSIAYDMQLGYPLPNDATLRRLRLDIVGIRNTLEWIRKETVKHKERLRRAFEPLKANRCILFYRGQYKHILRAAGTLARVGFPSDFDPDMPL
jgi:hypothetical protein